MNLLIQDEAKSKRVIDDNGFLIVKNNPIARAGVFEYLLREVKPNTPQDDNTIVSVYRPLDKLIDSKDEFANKPIMLNHTMIGKFGDSKDAQGSIGTEISVNGEFLVADLIIYNPDLIEAIQKGDIVELSPCYIGEIKESKGRFNGKDYDFIQEIKSVNHLAVVEKGRSGYELRIQDSSFKKGFTLKLRDFAKSLRLFADEAEKVEIESKDDDLDKREIVREIMAISAKPVDEFEGGEAEKVETIAKLAEKLAYNGDNETEVKDNKAETKDSECHTKDDDTEVSEVKEVKEVTNEVTKPNKEWVKELLLVVNELIENKINEALETKEAQEKAEEALIQDSYRQVSQALGMNFNRDGMKAKDIFRFGYECLTKNLLDKGMDSKTAFKMALGNRKRYIQDSKPNTEPKSDILMALEKMGGAK